MRQDIEDLKFELAQAKEVLIRFKGDMPENAYKVIFDLLYHSFNTIKDLEVRIYDECIKTRDNS